MFTTLLLNVIYIKKRRIIGLKKINSTYIAKLAGVSRSTVSRVINGYDNVPDETREKVMKVIRENEYYPMLSGQLLMGKSISTIGFFWVKHGSIAEDFMSSSFFTHVIEAASECGYLVLTGMIDNLESEENKNYIKGIFMQGRVDAGIFIGASNNEPLLENLISLGKVIGVFDHYVENNKDDNRISVNFDKNTGEQVIDYVYAKGHRKIAVINGSLDTYSGYNRRDGFLRGLKKYKLDVDKNWFVEGIEEEGGYIATKKILRKYKDNLPTVICANNDSTAFGVYKALEEFNIKIPDEISVVGVDGHAKGEYINPPLTTFEFNFEDMFNSLVRRTVNAIENKDNVEWTEFIPGKLVERRSCLQK